MSAVLLTVFHITWDLDSFKTFSWNQALSISDWTHADCVWSISDKWSDEKCSATARWTHGEICPWLCFSSYSLCILLGILLYDNYVIAIGVFHSYTLNTAWLVWWFTTSNCLYRHRQLLFFVVQYLTRLRPNLDGIYFSVGSEGILILPALTTVIFTHQIYNVIYLMLYIKHIRCKLFLTCTLFFISFFVKFLEAIFHQLTCCDFSEAIGRCGLTGVFLNPSSDCQLSNKYQKKYFWKRFQIDIETFLSVVGRQQHWLPLVLSQEC